MYGRLIKRVLAEPEVLTLLMDSTGGGTCDGGCLICARAIIRALGRGSLVRLVSHNTTINPSQDLVILTEHYGALVDGIIYDGLGAHSPRTWAKKFEKYGNLGMRLHLAEGLDDPDPDDIDAIPDDPRAVKTLTTILRHALGNYRKAINDSTITNHNNRTFIGPDRV